MSLPLGTDLPLFTRLAEQTLREVEPLLCFGQLLLHVLEAPFQRLEPGRDIGRQRLGTFGTQPSNRDHRERGNPEEDQQRGKEDWRFHRGVRWRRTVILPRPGGARTTPTRAPGARRQ